MYHWVYILIFYWPWPITKGVQLLNQAISSRLGSNMKYCKYSLSVVLEKFPDNESRKNSRIFVTHGTVINVTPSLGLREMPLSLNNRLPVVVLNLVPIRIMMSNFPVILIVVWRWTLRTFYFINGLLLPSHTLWIDMSSTTSTCPSSLLNLIVPSPTPTQNIIVIGWQLWWPITHNTSSQTGQIWNYPLVLENLF